MSEDDILSRHLTRRDVLRLGIAVGGAAAAGAVLAACGPAASSVAPATAAPTAAGSLPAATAAASPSAAQAGGKLVIGAFEDGALTPFKGTILPMFEAATGTPSVAGADVGTRRCRRAPPGGEGAGMSRRAAVACGPATT